MPRSKDGYKLYKAGDPIHFVVTQEFADTANEFFTYCKEKGYNPSEIIRQAIMEWYRRETTGEMRGENAPSGLSMDDKLALLASQNRGTQKKKKRALLSPREILDDQ